MWLEGSGSIDLLALDKRVRVMNEMLRCISISKAPDYIRELRLELAKKCIAAKRFDLLGELKMLPNDWIALNIEDIGKYESIEPEPMTVQQRNHWMGWPENFGLLEDPRKKTWADA